MRVFEKICSNYKPVGDVKRPVSLGNHALQLILACPGVDTELIARVSSLPNHVSIGNLNQVLSITRSYLGDVLKPVTGAGLTEPCSEHRMAADDRPEGILNSVSWYFSRYLYRDALVETRRSLKLGSMLEIEFLNRRNVERRISLLKVPGFLYPSFGDFSQILDRRALKNVME